MVAKSKPVKAPAPKSRRAPSVRPIGRPPLLDDEIDGFELGWLVPTEKAVSSVEPLLVRARPAYADGKEIGWRGYLVNASAAEGEKQWPSDLWTWATPEQGMQLDTASGSMGIAAQ